MPPPYQVAYKAFAAPAGGSPAPPPPPLPTSTSHPRARRDSTIMERHGGSGPFPDPTAIPKTTATTAFLTISSDSQSPRPSPVTTIPATAPPPTPSGASPADNPTTASPPSPRHRLEGLINTITCVLRCYAALPTRSPAYLDSLHSFRERAVGMYRQVGAGSGIGAGTGTETGTGTGNGSGTEDWTSSQVGPGVGNDVSSLSPSSYRALNSEDVDAPGSSQGLRGAVAGHHESTHAALGNHAPETLVTPRDSAPPSPSPSCGLSEQVEALEKEWWESEVVAAWFGPRPGCFTGASRTRPRERQRHTRENEGGARRLDLRRDTSYVGLYDE